MVPVSARANNAPQPPTNTPSARAKGQEVEEVRAMEKIIAVGAENRAREFIRERHPKMRRILFKKGGQEGGCLADRKRCLV